MKTFKRIAVTAFAAAALGVGAASIAVAQDAPQVGQREIVFSHLSSPSGREPRPPN